MFYKQVTIHSNVIVGKKILSNCVYPVTCYYKLEVANPKISKQGGMDLTNDKYWYVM